jgi:hypothetical protein
MSLFGRHSSCFHSFGTRGFSASAHLKGLYLVFQRLTQTVEKAAQTGGSLSPMARFIARLATIADHNLAGLYEQFPQWPVPTLEDEIQDRKCLVRLTGLGRNMTSTTVEWTLAAYEVENLWQRSYTFGKQSNMYRNLADAEAEKNIQKKYRLLMQHFEIWQQRPVIINHRIVLIPPLAGPLTTSVSGLHPQNKYYGKLLNQWRAAINIHGSRPLHRPLRAQFNESLQLCNRYMSDLRRLGCGHEYHTAMEMFAPCGPIQILVALELNLPTLPCSTTQQVMTPQLKRSQRNFVIVELLELSRPKKHAFDVLDTLSTW